MSVQSDKKTDAGPVPIASGVWRVTYLGLAGIFFALGAAGVFLPVLPTTPFLLLCSYFLVRASPRLNQMLLESRMFGPILFDWQQNGGVRRSVKRKAILLTVSCVAVSLLIADVSTRLCWIVAGLATIGIVVIVLLPEVRQPS